MPGLEPVFAELVGLGPTSLLAIALAVVFAGLVQASTGVGFGLIAAPILALVAPAFVPGAILLLGIVVTGGAALRELRQVNRPLLLAGIGGRLPGALVGALLAALLSPALFGIAFGALVLLAVVLSVSIPPLLPNRGNVFAAGFVSGVMGTLTSVGAPPMAIVMQRAPGPELRATTSAFLMFGAMISIVALALFSRFGLADVVRALVLIPFAYLGFYLSRWLVFDPRVNRLVRPAVLLLCVAMSLVLIADSRAGL